MIDKDQVLHVARLARLRLSEAEVARMSTELSSILEHIEKIAELDLDGVEPTSHVTEVQNVFRVDKARPSLTRGAALASAPAQADGTFAVPSPGASET